LIEQDKYTEQQEPSQEEVAASIAATLGETEFAPRSHIFQIVRATGRTAARELLAKTLETETNGGIMVPDGSRRRTPGGVFFYLAYTVGKTKNGKPLKRAYNNNQKGKKQPNQANKPENTNEQTKAPVNIPIAFSWEGRIEVVKEAEQEKGQANVKITVIGRPGKILDKGSCIVTVMESTKLPTLPKGLPTPTSVPTKYAVYIASKQWKKVEEAMKDPEDTLIIEGFPKTDSEVSAIAVFATNVTTKKLQMAKKQPQQTPQ